MDEGTLALRTAKLGANHPNTLNTRNSLALAYSEAGKWAEAIGFQEETVKLSTARLGPDNPDTLLYRSNLTTCLFRGGRLLEAIPMLEEVLKLEIAKLGPDNPETIRSRTTSPLSTPKPGGSPRQSSCTKRRSSCESRSSDLTTPTRSLTATTLPHFTSSSNVGPPLSRSGAKTWPSAASPANPVLPSWPATSPRSGGTS